MVYALFTNSLVNVIVGLTLVIAWRRHREQAFLRHLGLATLALAAVGPGYVWWKSAGPVGATVAAVLIVASAGAGLLLMSVGAVGLAGRRLTRRQLAIGAALLAAVYVALVPGHMRAAHGVTAALMIGIGLVAARWLWPQPTAERLSGVLLVLLGLNNFWFTAFGESGAAIQAALGTVMRAALGMGLLYAALRRSSEAAQRMRDQYLRMTEKSHFGVIVIQDDRVPYANRAAHQIYDRPLDRPFPLP